MKTVLWLTLLTSLSLRAQFSLPSHLTDEANLLSYTFEKRMNHYLASFHEHAGVYLSAHYLQSLRGGELEQKADELLEQEGQTEAVILLLSLSDRQFTIKASADLQQYLDPSYLSFVSDGLTSYIKRREFDRALLFFSEQIIHKLADDFTVKPPPPSHKQFLSARGLLFFAIIALIVFLFGRSIQRARLLFTGSALTRTNRRRISGRW